MIGRLEDVKATETLPFVLGVYFVTFQGRLSNFGGGTEVVYDRAMARDFPQR